MALAQLYDDAPLMTVTFILLFQLHGGVKETFFPGQEGKESSG